MLKKFFVLAAISILLTVCKTGGAASSKYVFTISDIPAFKVRTELPFSKGVNFNGWLDASSPRSISFTSFTEQDFINVKTLGCDVIRLPLRLHSMTGGAPSYTIDPLFFGFLDQAIDWAEKHRIYLILDNHSFRADDPTTPEIEPVLTSVWRQLATRYKDRSEYILYEILNEPYGIDLGLWAEIQGRVIPVIRAADSVHYIIVGGADYNDVNALFSLPEYPYEKLIYTFHFYDPSLFTHQGTWGELLSLSGLPFPAEARMMPPLPASFNGTWVETLYGLYPQDATLRALTRQLDKAAMFSQEHGDIPLFCGEYGANNINILQEDRVRWYEAATKFLENRNIPRTIWGYNGGFGIYNTENGGAFESDLNIEIVRAAGFTAPPQKPPQKIREAITLFDDYAVPVLLTEIQHWDSELDLHHRESGKNLISWGNAKGLGTLIFSFKDMIDWQYMKDQNYAVTFRAKADRAANIDIRFINRETVNTFPWRIITNVNIPGDGQWRNYRIPLNDMNDEGAWSNLQSVWYAPQGKFSWDNIASFSIMAGANGLPGTTVFFDAIKIEP